MSYVHLVARIRQRRPILNDWTRASALWRRLLEAFPHALSWVLMPEHLHLLTPEAGGLRGKLSRVCQSFSLSFKLGAGTWDPVPEPEPVRDLSHLKRQVRYVHLNPSRRGLNRDPLDWVWSTHRDWLNPSSFLAHRIKPVLDRWKWSRARFHDYVSSDPTCSVTGTPMLLPSKELNLSRDVSLQSVLRALLGVSRLPIEELIQQPRGRDLLLALARQLTPYSQSELALSLGLSRGAVTYAVRRAAKREELQSYLEQVRRALLDPRLTLRTPSPAVLSALLNDPFKREGSV